MFLAFDYEQLRHGAHSLHWQSSFRVAVLTTISRAGIMISSVAECYEVFATDFRESFFPPLEDHSPTCAKPAGCIRYLSPFSCTRPIPNIPMEQLTVLTLTPSFHGGLSSSQLHFAFWAHVGESRQHLVPFWDRSLGTDRLPMTKL